MHLSNDKFDKSTRVYQDSDRAHMSTMSQILSPYPNSVLLTIKAAIVRGNIDENQCRSHFHIMKLLLSFIHVVLLAISIAPATLAVPASYAAPALLDPRAPICCQPTSDGCDCYASIGTICYKVCVRTSSNRRMCLY
jgi:hypothetical protein